MKKNSKSEESSKMTTLWKCDECFVYRVPPRKMGSRGYRADEWDLASPRVDVSFRNSGYEGELSCKAFR